MKRRDWLKEIRLSKGLTQVEVADQVEISLRFYQMIEQGVKTPSIKNAMKIGDLLEFDFIKLFTA